MAPAHPVMRRVDVTLKRESSDTGWTGTAQMSPLGRAGRILVVKVREDATEDYATQAVLYIAKSSTAITSAPADENIYYESGTIALAGSSTGASLADALPVPAPYLVDVPQNLRMAANITAGTGADDTHLYVTIVAEVWE